MTTSSTPASTPSDEPSTPARPDAREYLRLVLLGAAVGLPAALVAALFLAIVHEVEQLLWTDLPDALGADSPPWYLVVGLPVVGAGIVVLARRLLPGDGGHPPLDGIDVSPTPISYAPGIALAAIGSLAFGAVLGPEAPLIALGCATALAVTSFVRVGDPGRRVVGLAGSFSAISALFGGPLVAGMLLVEAGVGMGAALLPTLVPGFVAAAVGYVVFVGLGDWGGLATTSLVVPGLPEYDGTRVVDLLVAVLVGVAGGAIVVAVRRAAKRIDSQHTVAMGPVLLAGGLAVGLLALAARGLGADSQAVLFSGQVSIPETAFETSVSVLVVLLVAKGLAYAISLGCGFRGGPVFPAIFLGIALAALVAVVIDASPTWVVAVGTAVGTAAVTRLLVAPVLFGALLVGTAGLDAIPAAVLGAVAAFIVVHALEPERGTASGADGAHTRPAEG